MGKVFWNLNPLKESYGSKLEIPLRGGGGISETKPFKGKYGLGKSELKSKRFEESHGPKLEIP